MRRSLVKRNKHLCTVILEWGSLPLLPHNFCQSVKTILLALPRMVIKGGMRESKGRSRNTVSPWQALSRPSKTRMKDTMVGLIPRDFGIAFYSIYSKLWCYYGIHKQHITTLSSVNWTKLATKRTGFILVRDMQAELFSVDHLRFTN